MVIFLFCNLQSLQVLPINYMEKIQGADTLRQSTIDKTGDMQEYLNFFMALKT